MLTTFVLYKEGGSRVNNNKAVVNYLIPVDGSGVFIRYLFWIFGWWCVLSDSTTSKN